MDKKYDFSGWATKCNIRCTDGRIIMPDAFKHCDGQKVPLIWNHGHRKLSDVLGHALLEHRDEGIYAYCSFNDTDDAKRAKALVQHGDIAALSIYANGLRHQGSAVMHGEIREVSLVLAGANPGASIQSIMLKHGDTWEESEDEAQIFNDDDDFEFFHSDEEDEKEETVEEILDTLTDKQRKVVYNLVGEALKQDPSENDKDDQDTDADDKDENDDGHLKHDDLNDEEDNDMKKNVFDKEDRDRKDVLSHADQQAIIAMAKSTNVGSFRAALDLYAEEHDIKHDAISGGFAQTGEGNIYNLFPEYKEVRPGAPELITNDQGWISTVLAKVHKSPISRIRTSQVDIRNLDPLRAKGYAKGKEKAMSGNFALLRRTTDPQTIYVKNALHRDDIIDITDFDYVEYLYNIDKMMLNEELATAIMIGDGRDIGDDAKIAPDHIRPIWTDDDLYTIHVDLDINSAKAELQGSNTGANFGENYIYAEAVINTVLYSREKYKGSGTPDFYCTPHMLNVMLLARDLNGRRIYSSKAELASALNVGDIITAEQFEGKTRITSDNKEKKLLGIIANLADYSLGATKGGEVTHRTQFDIDFNQEKSLLETRCSGALTRAYSAIAIEMPTDKKPSSNTPDSSTQVAG